MAGRRPRGKGAADERGFTKDTGLVVDAALDSADGGEGSGPRDGTSGQLRMIAPERERRFVGGGGRSFVTEAVLLPT